MPSTRLRFSYAKRGKARLQSGSCAGIDVAGSLRLGPADKSIYLVQYRPTICQIRVL